MDTETQDFYTAQSTFSDPGALTELLDGLPQDLAGLQRVARGLVIHYRGDDPLGNGIPEERMREIDTRYADAMLGRLEELRPGRLDAERRPVERLVGCCRDFTLLFVALARHAGMAVRSRTGYATYFPPGWAVDHVVAEVWDESEQRWRLVDPELGDEHVDQADGARVDPLDIPRDRFLTGGVAWSGCRAGEYDPERFVVDPGLEIPETRGWSQLQYSLVHDLAALNRHELLLWDGWGLAGRVPTPDEFVLLDEVAALTSQADPPLAELERLYADEHLRVPSQVVSHDPLGGPPREVALR
jgi:hypothetical protein